MRPGGRLGDRVDAQAEVAGVASHPSFSWTGRRHPCFEAPPRERRVAVELCVESSGEVGPRSTGRRCSDGARSRCAPCVVLLLAAGSLWPAAPVLWSRRSTLSRPSLPARTCAPAGGAARACPRTRATTPREARGSRCCSACSPLGARRALQRKQICWLRNDAALGTNFTPSRKRAHPPETDLGREQVTEVIGCYDAGAPAPPGACSIGPLNSLKLPVLRQQG